MPKLVYRSFIGIDPGQSGGIAWLGNDGTVLDCIKMPATEADLWRWFDKDVRQGPKGLIHAAIEKVHAMPKQGVSSTFKFGMEYGGLRMALIAAGIPFDQVTPQAWIKALGIHSKKKTETGTQWKNRLRAQAQQLFPRETITLAKADALLIAEYCRRTYR